MRRDAKPCQGTKLGVFLILAADGGEVSNSEFVFHITPIVPRRVARATSPVNGGRKAPHSSSPACGGGVRAADGGGWKRTLLLSELLQFTRQRIRIFRNVPGAETDDVVALFRDVGDDARQLVETL